MTPPTMAPLSVNDADLAASWTTFFDRYSAGIIDQTYQAFPEKRSVVLDFRELDQRAPDIAEALLVRPTAALRIGESLLSQFDTGIDVLGKGRPHLGLQLRGLPDYFWKTPNQLSSEHLGRLVAVESLVVGVEKSEEVVERAVWQCKACTATVALEQTDEFRSHPQHCDICNKPTSWTFLPDQSTWHPAQTVYLGEPPERGMASTGAPLMARLEKEDLIWPTEERLDYSMRPGDRVVAFGILRPVVKRRHGKDSTSHAHRLDVVGFEHVSHDRLDVDLSPEDEERFRQLSTSIDWPERVAASIAPQLHGLHTEKLAILLSAIGGIDDSKKNKRGRVHVLLAGDPSTGKTDLLRWMKRVVPRIEYSDGSTATTVGLTAGKQQSEATGHWMMVPGQLVRAHRGVAVIDELAKLVGRSGPDGQSDAQVLNTCMQSGCVEVTGIIHGTLPADCTVWAAMNPPGLGRIDPFDSILGQLGLHDSLRTRFHVILIVRDVPRQEDDRAKARKILGLEEPGEACLSEGDLAKIVYLAQNASPGKQRRPEWDSEAHERIIAFWEDARSNSEDVAPAATRHLTALRVLAEASARLRFADVVDLVDADLAIQVIRTSFESVGVLDKKGDFDFDAFEIGTSKKTVENMRLVKQLVKDIIAERKKEGYSPWAPEDMVLQEAATHALDHDTIAACLAAMIRDRTLYHKGGHGTYAPLRD